MKKKTTDAENLFKINGADYTEHHNILGLIGPAPQFREFTPQRSLLDKIARAHHPTVVFENIDQMHPDIITTLFNLESGGKMSLKEMVQTSPTEFLILNKVTTAFAQDKPKR